MPRQRFVTAVAALALTLLAAGCSSSGSSAGGSRTPTARSGAGSTSSSAKSSSSAGGAVSGVSERYANFFTLNGAAGPGIDIYEGTAGQQSTVLVRDVAYGAVSDYVHPHLMPGVPAGSQGKYLLPLFAIPTGENPSAHPSDASLLSPQYDDGSHAQVTLLIQGDPNASETGPLRGLRVGTRLERGTFNGQTTPDLPAPGTTELLADGSTPAFDGATNVGQTYLLIDRSCTRPTNAKAGATTGPAIVSTSNLTATKYLFAVFPQSAGSHRVSVSAAGTCPSSAGKGATTVTLTAGQQVEVFVYGLSPSDLHLVAAPVGS